MSRVQSNLNYVLPNTYAHLDPKSPNKDVEPFPNLDLLSLQERRVLALFALDYTNKEAARELAIHPETVKTYARRICLKLGMHSKAGCVAAAYTRLME